MRTLNRTWTIAAATLVAISAFGQNAARPAALMVGDPAPRLAVAKWVKGTPVASLDKGKIYVVEFWATWCGPCKESIPHLTELRKKFGDSATFIGVSSFENNWNGVEPFVKSEGDQMDYDVAMDKIAHPDDREGFMAKNWMEAAHQPGIPTAFVIDKAGKIAWIGHPMNLEEPLGKVIDGTWDRTAFAHQYAADMQKQLDEENSPLRKLMKQFSVEMGQKHWTEALATIDKAAPDLPAGPDQAELMRLSVYASSGNSEKYSEAAQKLMAGKLKDQPQILNSIAWDIVDPKSKFTHRDLKLAQKAAERSVEISNRSQPEALDTLAWTYYWMGDNAKAISTENEALSKATGDKSTYENTLKTFQSGPKS